MIRIAIAGCRGKMGQMLVRAVSEFPSLQLTAATVSPGSDTTQDVGVLAGIAPLGLFPTTDLASCIKAFDVLIDFTGVQSTLAHVALAREYGKKMIIGTTGFSPDAIARIQDASRDIPILLSANMSIGVNLCFQLLQKMAQTLNGLAEVEIVEAHHSHKKDAPSGTALTMGKIIAQARGQDLETVAVYDRRTTQRTPDDIGFSCIRGQDIIGEHSVLFALAGEQIILSHKASDRAIYAKGALKAAQWIAHQPAGWYSMQDILF